jgi:hypothetical protein
MRGRSDSWTSRVCRKAAAFLTRSLVQPRPPPARAPRCADSSRVRDRLTYAAPDQGSRGVPCLAQLLRGDVRAGADEDGEKRRLRGRWLTERQPTTPVCLRPERQHWGSAAVPPGLATPGLAVIRPGRPIGSMSDSIPGVEGGSLAYGSSSARLATTFATASTFLDLNVRPRHRRPMPSGVQLGPGRGSNNRSLLVSFPLPRLSGGWAAAVPAPAQSSPSAEARSARRARRQTMGERTSTLSAGQGGEQRAFRESRTKEGPASRALSVEVLRSS